MRKNLNLVGTALLFVLLGIGCQEERPFLGVDQFNLQPGALEEGEHVKFLYYSGPSRDADTYLAQVIAVSEVDGDTFNILFPSNVSVADDDNKATFVFYSFKSPAYMEHSLKDDKFWTSEESVLQNIHKVTRDTRYDDMAINHYPTCIGIPMKVMSE